MGKHSAANMDSAHESLKPARKAEPFTCYVLIMGMGFFGIFMAFNTAQALQSTLNKTLGNACLCTLYGTFTVACLVGPLVVDRWGPKISMIVGATTYIAMVLSNLKPSWALSIPMYFLVGFGAPLLWTGQNVYLSRCAVKAALNEMEQVIDQESGGDAVPGTPIDGRGIPLISDAGNTESALMKRFKDLNKKKLEEFNGYFFSFFQANGCLGLLMASIIQSQTSNVKFLFIILSVICGVGVLIVTFGFPNVKNVEPEEELCGADLSKQTPRSRSMSSISEAASNMAEDNLDEALSTSEGLKETLLFGFKNPRFGLFIPIILYNGMSLGFFLSDATRYFIAEAIGNSNIGYVLSAFYGINLMFTALAGKGLVKRSKLVAGASLIHIVFFVLMLVLRPWLLDADTTLLANGTTENSRYYIDDATGDWTHKTDSTDATAATWLMVFVFATLFAAGDAVWESQVPATISGYYPSGKENAYMAANLKMWQSFGFAAQFAIDVLYPSLASGDKNHINDLLYVKVLLLLFFLLVGSVGIYKCHSMVGGSLDAGGEEEAHEKADTQK